MTPNKTERTDLALAVAELMLTDLFHLRDGKHAHRLRHEVRKRFPTVTAWTWNRARAIAREIHLADKQFANMEALPPITSETIMKPKTTRRRSR